MITEYNLFFSYLIIRDFFVGLQAYEDNHHLTNGGLFFYILLFYAKAKSTNKIAKKIAKVSSTGTMRFKSRQSIGTFARATFSSLQHGFLNGAGLLVLLG